MFLVCYNSMRNSNKTQNVASVVVVVALSFVVRVLNTHMIAITERQRHDAERQKAAISCGRGAEENDAQALVD